MASTTFIDYAPSTPIVAAWLNDVNRTQYTILNNPTTVADIITALGLGGIYSPIALTQFGTSITGNTTLLVADSGKDFTISAGIATLPTAAAGLRYELIGVGAATGSIAAPAGVTLHYPDGTSTVAGTILVGLGTTVKVICDGTGWYVINTSGQVITKTGTTSNHAVNFGQAFGLGQTYQDMTASRSFASNFTNSSTKTIFIILDIYFGNSSGVTITVNGITFTQGSTNNEHRVFSFPVLPGGV